MIDTAVISLSTLAVEKLQEVLKEEGVPGAALRIIVSPNGNGAQYMLALEEKESEGDLVVYESGVKVIVDDESLELVRGAEIDYVEGLMRSGFVITNPNLPATAGTCACGNASCACGG